MNKKPRKRNPIRHTLTEIYVVASSKESLLKVWNTSQTPEALSLVHGKTRQDTNVFFPYHYIEELENGLLKGYFVVQRDNVRGNWKSDITRTVQAAAVLAGLQIPVDGEVIWHFEVEK